MTGWIVFGCVLLVLFLLSRLRLGGRAEYSSEGFTAWVKAGPLLLRVFPPKPGEPSKKPRPEKKKEPEQEKKKGGSPDLLMSMLPLIFEAVGRVTRTIRVDKLYLDFVSASQDPASAAMSFGYANAAIGMIWPLLAQNLNIKDRRIRTNVSFRQTQSTVYLLAQVTITVGQLLALAVLLLVKFLKRYHAFKQEQAEEQTQKEAV